MRRYNTYRKLQLLAHSERANEHVHLLDVGGNAAHLLRRNLVAVHRHMASPLDIGLVDVDEDVHQRRLARTASAHDC